MIAELVLTATTLVAAPTEPFTNHAEIHEPDPARVFLHELADAYRLVGYLEHLKAQNVAAGAAFAANARPAAEARAGRDTTDTTDRTPRSIQTRPSSDTSGTTGSVNGYPCGGPLPPCHVLQRESGGNPTAENNTSTASGLWQFIDGTWDGYGGYPHASDAPPEVQNQKAIELYAGGAGCGHWAPTDGCG